ncbi:GAF domain-containing protein [Stackebrandtia nassauensis]|uniref:Putative phytochrome sensor protein n=1 Tax=Stackebrandtia nassauensis (strain DSM 44728 / CIP 108903 / NRRL B-16338 / NBRC 102104 / LLR-40K-21) TaxID=446470 RepID=D3PYB1_STANL|nr:helix-turn-helix domain-containing protein [Stackebrandtia nassauensis]ADD41478.1 putative phytochrome sensor protein [Stackebrandtia nassauensis DSM 44728]
MSRDPLAHTLVPDPVAYARRMRRLRDDMLAGTVSGDAPRDLITASWRRSLTARVDPDADGPVVVYADGAVDYRREHPLAACLPLLRHTLLSIAEEAMHVMIVTDADGTMLWREGHASVQLRADRVGLSPGTSWAEASIGTNAMGTTLAIDRPVQIYSAEHLVSTYHDWTCAAAPVHDPDTGEILGAVDISGPLHTIHPATVALVSAAARLAESRLAELADERDRRFARRHQSRLGDRPGALLTATGRVLAATATGLPERVDPGESRLGGRRVWVEPLDEGYLLRLENGPVTRTAASPRLRLRVLGEEQPTVEVAGRVLPLPRRHAEILTVLAMHPAGLTAGQLAFHLYGDDGNPVTVRTEIHRLRAHLGQRVLVTKPYRLAADADVDFLTVDRSLRHGDVGAAVASFRGGLLPYSEAPAIRAAREEQLAALRGAVLARPDVDLLWSVIRFPPCDGDLGLLEALCEHTPRSDARHHWALARLAAVDDGD